MGRKQTVFYDENDRICVQNYVDSLSKFFLSFCQTEHFICHPIVYVIFVQNNRSAVCTIQ